MSITFDAHSRLFKLDAGSNTTYAFFIEANGYLTHLYYGPRVAGDCLLNQLRNQDRAFSPCPVGHKSPAAREAHSQEFAGFNTGDYRTPSAKVFSASGHLATDMRYQSHRIYAGKPALPGLPATFADKNQAETLELTLVDEPGKMEYVLLYTVFRDFNVITRSVNVANRGTDVVYLEKISSCTVDFAEYYKPFDLISLQGAWARERNVERTSLRHGIHTLSSGRGLSGHNLNPFFALAEPETTETQGRIFGFALLYSGNFSAEIEYNQFNEVRTQFGINQENFRWRLAPGEVFTAPEVAMVHAENGVGGMSRTFHDLFRTNLIRSYWRDRKRPILINNWEGTYFNFDNEKLLAIAGSAAKLGIEMLVLDDGWFGKRNDDSTSLGDWFVNEDKLKGGLKYLSEEVNKLGMKFGLWFEPEMVSPISKLHEAHPDWCLHIPGRPGSLGRQQLVLDMSRKEVVDYLFETICGVLDNANIEYIKWDANRSLSEVGSAILPPDRQLEVSHRFVLGTYELHERLLQRYPKLLIEGCSGGGGRFDAGMLYYVPQIWTSDDSDAIERLKIQYGTSLVYPCSAMGAHVSDCPNHQTGRITPFQTRGIVALEGTFGYELDLNKIAQSERDQVPEQVALYHQINPIVAQGDLYRLTDPAKDPVVAWMNVAKDGSQFVVSAVTPQNHASYPFISIRLQGLESEAEYVQESSGLTFRGDHLMNVGYQLPIPTFDGAAVLLHFHRK